MLIQPINLRNRAELLYFDNLQEDVYICNRILVVYIGICE